MRIEELEELLGRYHRGEITDPLEEISLVRAVVCTAVEMIAEGDWEGGNRAVDYVKSTDAVGSLLMFLGTAVALLQEGTGQSVQDVILGLETTANNKARNLLPDLISEVRQHSPEAATRFESLLDSIGVTL